MRNAKKRILITLYRQRHQWHGARAGGGYIPTPAPSGRCCAPFGSPPPGYGGGAGQFSPLLDSSGHRRAGMEQDRPGDRQSYDALRRLCGAPRHRHHGYSASRPLLYAGKPVKNRWCSPAHQIPCASCAATAGRTISSTPWPSPPPAKSMRCASISMGCCCGATAPAEILGSVCRLRFSQRPASGGCGHQIGYHESALRPLSGEPLRLRYSRNPHRRLKVFPGIQFDLFASI